MWLMSIKFNLKRENSYLDEKERQPQEHDQEIAKICIPIVLLMGKTILGGNSSHRNVQWREG